MATVDFTLDDLKKIFATKDDLKNFATKDDIREMIEESEERIVSAVNASIEAYDEKHEGRFLSIEHRLTGIEKKLEKVHIT
jgi:hypothetical protein